ncbi:MAG: proteinsorting protein/MYXO-CTERM protein [Verrucomicrobia bacterium]|nr:proteinsorting protein/MYXO-CTERM protein [Verrucomicrobiota bacterium]
MLKLAGVALLALALGTAVKADPSIGGQIHIDAFGSTVSVDFTTHHITFNSPNPSNAQVSFTSGDYNGLLGAAANYADLTYSPFVPQTLWTITLTPTTYFYLDTIFLVDETSTVGVSLWGTGTAYMAGHAATTGSWTFSASRNQEDAVFNFSSSTSVPDGGTTALLVGLGLVGMSVVARRRK